MSLAAQRKPIILLQDFQIKTHKKPKTNAFGEALASLVESNVAFLAISPKNQQRRGCGARPEASRVRQLLGKILSVHICRWVVGWFCGFVLLFFVYGFFFFLLEMVNREYFTSLPGRIDVFFPASINWGGFWERRSGDGTERRR